LEVWVERKHGEFRVESGNGHEAEEE